MPIKEKNFNFRIGADPEFILTMQGRKVDAKQTMELMLKGKTGFIYNSNKGGFDIEPYGNIGWDGASSTAEVRPNAHNKPSEVTNNLREMFKAMIKHIKICDLSTISEFSSIGGHIHLEIPQGEKWSTEKKNTVHKRLTSFYLPALISENKTNLSLRLQQNYGSLKDHRIEQKFKHPDGTPGLTFEFRSPSAEWLTTPKLTEATLAYIGTIYHEILNHPKSFSKFNDLVYKNDKQGDALQALAIMEFSLLTDSILKKAHKYIKTFEMYETYKKEIEYIFNPKQIIKDKQNANFNIALGWELVGKSTVPKKTEILSSKKHIQSIANKTDFDILKRVMNIHYNDDTNVALFAETFKDRVAAFNWKLKNNYFIFGMRKGINSLVVKNLKGNYIAGKEILKTILDRDQMDKIFEKMNIKFGNQTNLTSETTIDFVTGKPKDTRDTMITIGIPYKMRIDEDIKPFLNFIWSLEKGEIQEMSKKEEKNLINDLDLPLEEQGEIYKILTKQIETPQEIVMDNNSTSRNNHIRAVQEVLQETRS